MVSSAVPSLYWWYLGLGSLVILALVVAGCGAPPAQQLPETGATPTAGAPAGTTPDDAPAGDSAGVQIVDNSFQPASLSAAARVAVTWTHSGSNPHTATADDGSFSSGRLSPGDTFQFTFDQPGTYAYYCEVHGGPGGTGMSGVIVVESPH